MTTYAISTFASQISDVRSYAVAAKSTVTVDLAFEAILRVVALSARSARGVLGLFCIALLVHLL